MVIRAHAILGAGGTGKSFHINSIISKDRTYAYRTASTGIAAVNLGPLSGSNMPRTINSALGFYDVESLLYAVATKRIFMYLNNIWNSYRNLIIDEVSMLNAGTLDLIFAAIARFNKEKEADLGLIVLGDSGQLPAVSGKPFFKAKSWPHFKVEFFTKVKRQSDAEFIQALSSVRKGRVEEVADWFEENVGFEDEVDTHFDGLTFFSTNSEVNSFNQECMSRIPNNPVVYRANLKGKPEASWKTLPSKVVLKKGSLVRMLFNNISEGGWANGDCGYILELFKNTIRVKLVRNAKVVCVPMNELIHTDMITKKEVGWLKLMQVKLAYASTIHSAQGLTTDGAQVILGHPFLRRLSGGLYTAISRVRSKEGLRLVGTKEQFINSCYLDPAYLPWIK